MVSMVIILFLVAVLVSLCAGRLAEILLRKMREQTVAPAGEHHRSKKPEGRIPGTGRAEITSRTG